MNHTCEKRLLQAAITIACLVPLSAGLSGAFMGTGLLHEATGADMQSHFRYLSGLLLGIGIGYARLIPHIERNSRPVRILTLIVFIGGVARLYSIPASGAPSLPMQLALVMELIVTPALCLWQRRIAALHNG